MRIWAMFWSALCFWIVSNFEFYAIPVGALVGLLIGYTLMRSVRTYVRLEAEALSKIQSAQLREQLRSEFAAQGGSLKQFSSAQETGVFNVQSAPVDGSDALSDQAATLSVNRPPVQPRGPSIAQKVFAAALSWLTGGNTVVRIGVVILFIGLLFLAKYAADNAMFPIELRMAGVGLAGFGLLFTGFKLRNSKTAYAMTLQGAGVAVIYLAVFASFKLYGLLPVGLAIGLMLGVCALSTAIALLQNSLTMAVIAFAGGFVAPILVSTGSGQFEVLFAYYLVLSLAILFIAYKRSWRILHLLGFVFSFGVMALWANKNYEPSLLLKIEPFLIGFFLIYVITPILYAFKTATVFNKTSSGTVDASLVFGVPIATMGLQSIFIQHIDFGLALSSLALALFYVIVAALLIKKRIQTQRLLIECFLALSVGFITLAVPLALDARWTAAVWAVEGAGLFWVGIRQARWMPRAFGLLLQVIAAVSFTGYPYTQTSKGADGSVIASPMVANPMFANPIFVGALLLAASAIALSWWTRRALAHSDSTFAKIYARFEIILSPILFTGGFFWWMYALVHEIYRANVSRLSVYAHLFSGELQARFAMLAFIASAFVSAYWGKRLGFPIAQWPAHGTAIAIFLGALNATILGVVLRGESGSLLQSAINWAAWALSLGLHILLLRRLDTQNPSAVKVVLGKAGTVRPWFTAMHVLGVWALLLLVGNALVIAIGKGDLWQTAWAAVVLLVSGILVLLALVFWVRNAKAQIVWPLNHIKSAYQWFAAAPIAVLVFIGTIGVALFSNGRADPLPYIPLLNPTDLSVALGLAACLIWARGLSMDNDIAKHPNEQLSQRDLGPNPPSQLARKSLGFLHSNLAKAFFGGAIFIFINTVWLRVAHHFANIPWRAEDLFASFLVQTGYAILWTTIALGLMIIAHRRVSRTTWMVGAALLGLTVVKLFVIDLSNRGGSERIFTFVGVGLLMLIVGYLAPLPPQAKPSDSPK